MTDLTQTSLKSVLHYNKDTGIFTRIAKTSFCVQLGEIAGGFDIKGYIRISVFNKRYKAHRLAFLYMTGRWPKDQVDHINHIKDDNRWVNLRECSQTQNKGNTPLRKNNKSGFKGVCWHKNGGKWQAAIRVNNKRFFLGLFDNKKDAAIAYNSAAVKEFGKFACLNEIVQ